ncbi:MAG: ATP-binding protein [Burkholderiaceae bacterium]
MNLGPAYVQACAVICGLLALLFGWIRWRHGDPGTGWLALGFLCVFALFAFSLGLPPDDSQVAHRGASLFGAVAVLCLGWGLIEYVGPSLRRPGRWRVAVALPMLVALAWLPFGALPRTGGHALIALSMTMMAAIAWVAARREPGTGLQLIAVASLLHPVLLVAMLLADIDVYELRNVVIVPISVFGMTLFAISLTRARVRVEHELAARVDAQRALEELNETLEQRVTQRTGELHEIVAALESFNRTVSHDLRGPLGGMAQLTRLALAEMARGETVRARPMLDAVARQADSLGELVTDLLLLARVGDVELSLRTVDLAECVRQAQEQLRLAGHSTQPIEAGELGSVAADAGLLRQVIVNLVGNALKFSRDVPYPRVRIEQVPDLDRKVIVVRDNGTGFDARCAGELFDPFKRFHASTFEGTGLGLAIVRRIVERHGGSVWAEGAPGQGASFYVALPQRTL